MAQLLPECSQLFHPFFFTPSPRVLPLCVNVLTLLPYPTSPPWLSSCARCGCHTFTSPKMRLDLGGAEREHELSVSGMIYWL